MKSTRWRRVAWSLFVCLLPWSVVRAELVLSLGDIQAEDWRAEGVALRLADAAPGRYAMRLDVRNIVLPGGEWRDVQLACAALQLDAGYRCAAANLQLEGPLGRQQLAGRFAFVDAGHWDIEFTGLTMAGGRWSLKGRAEDSWQLVVQGEGAVLGELLALLPAEVGLPAWDWRGVLGTRLKIQGQGSAPGQIHADLKLTDAGYASDDGLQAAEGLAAQLRLDGRRDGKRWRFDTRLRLSQGQCYADPVFIDLGGQPLALDLRGHWTPGSDAVELTKAQGSLGSLLSVQGKGRAWPLDGAAGALQVRVHDLAGVYPLLLQPMAHGTALDRLSIGGSAELALTWRADALQTASLALNQVTLDDEAGRFGLTGLAGQLHWLAAEAGPAPAASRLGWQEGNLYRIGFGAGQVAMEAQGDQLRLTAPLAIPTLGGRLHIPRFELQGLGGETPVWWTALSAESLSLPDLTAALAWPTLEGSLTVQIPAVSYAAGELGVNGELRVQAFDGTVLVNGLRLSEPFGSVPTLQAEASLRGLDLEKLTGAFDLGRITGRLEGDVHDLELVGWEPVRFSAHLSTPAGDDSAHRISQRAVENLTALGNNGAVALSGTFLRFFESFAYDRLLLKVDLEGQLATLDGIAHPDGGYYLVKGRGLPRIDVIGRNRQVAWRDLVERLQRIRVEGMQTR